MRISKAITGLFLCGFVASVAVPVFGQDEGRRQRGGAQGGGGGRGAGMGMMGGQGLAGLLMMEQVQTHLKLDEAQKGELKTLQESAAEDMRKMFTDMREAGGDFSVMQEKMREFMSKLDSKIEEILDPDQFDRLLGLFAQRGLVQALTHKAIGERLELSQDTLGSIRKVEEESNAAMRNVFQRPEGGQGGGFGGGGNREEMQKRMEEMREKMQQARKESEDKILGLLSADQKDKLEKLKGEKFEFPEGRGFGFGGFGGGAGGPGGGGGGGRRGGGNP
ncbi:MAG: hypothetical protein MUC43_15930 [Pirellula sp.]|jgi:hypothetical protein|nr:hypothetical protein [Pirellula sp.]